MKNINYILFQGNFKILSGFSLINRHLVNGLTDIGYKVKVFPTDSAMKGAYPKTIPDVYIFHGHPYDYKNAPGKFNIFILSYDYFNISKEDEILVNRLNSYFNLLIVPTYFAKNVCKKGGVKIPIKVCPWGVDNRKFSLSAKPKKIPTLKNFKFIYLGGTYDRKGTDILLKAYVEEFSPKEEVALIIKAFSYEHFKPWVDKAMSQAGVNKDNAPEVVYIHKEEKDISGYLTASDAGVFPFRGEGFGMPILECIACGRPVIVTKGAGPIDFCNQENARFIKTTTKIHKGKIYLEPDKEHLKRLMREAFEQGKLSREKQQEISATISKFTWERTVRLLDAAIKNRLKPKINSSVVTGKTFTFPSILHAYYTKGKASWKKAHREIDDILRRNYSTYYSLNFVQKPTFKKVDIVLGQSDFCLELFQKAKSLNPGVLKILHRESAPMEVMHEIINKERSICGLGPVYERPIKLWRSRIEHDLADYFILVSNVSKEFYLKAGYPEYKLKVINLGIDIHKPYFRKRPNKVRFLFVGTDPFRKGIRLLLQAWDELKPGGAELICIADKEILHSGLILKYLVRNPNVQFKEFMPYQKFLNEYHDIDCQVLPSLEDGFSFVISEGMGYGKPAIISDKTGTKDIMTHLRDGYIFKSGSVEGLKKGIVYFCENRKRIKEMGEAAYDTAKKHSWERFGINLISLISSLYSQCKSKTNC